MQPTLNLLFGDSPAPATPATPATGATPDTQTVAATFANELGLSVSTATALAPGSGKELPGFGKDLPIWRPPIDVRSDATIDPELIVASLNRQLDVLDASPESDVADMIDAETALPPAADALPATLKPASPAPAPDLIGDTHLPLEARTTNTASTAAPPVTPVPLIAAAPSAPALPTASAPPAPALPTASAPPVVPALPTAPASPVASALPTASAPAAATVVDHRADRSELLSRQMSANEHRSGREPQPDGARAEVMPKVVEATGLRQNSQSVAGLTPAAEHSLVGVSAEDAVVKVSPSLANPVAQAAPDIALTLATSGRMTNESLLPPSPAALPTLPVPVQEAGWGDALAERVRLMANNQLQRAEIQLSPAELGPLRVRLTIEDGAASIVFSAQHVVTRDAIEQALPRLREMLAESGLSLEQASVGDEGVAQKRHGGDQRAETGADRSLGEDSEAGASLADRSEPAPELRVQDGFVDTFA